MTVLLYPTGAPVDWAELKRNPRRVELPAVSSMKTSGGHVIHGSMFVICWLEWANAKALKKYGRGLVVIQSCYNTGVAASAGTHDGDYCLDVEIPGIAFSEVQRFLRFECGSFFWWRTPAQGFSNHCHGFPLPPGGHLFPTAVGEYVDGGLSTVGHLITSSQIEDGWNNSYGLKGMHDSGEDRSPWPSSTAKLKGVFDLDAFIAIQAQGEDMGYAEWTPADKKAFWDDFKQFIDGPQMAVGLKTGDGKDKTIPFLNAIQRSAAANPPRS